MIARLTAWLGAWKYVLTLGALFAGSVYWNLHQWKEAALVASRAETAVWKDVAKSNAQIGRQAQIDTAQLYTDLSGIAQREKEWRSRYSVIAAKNPLPANCAPGKARMDAVNSGIPATGPSQ